MLHQQAKIKEYIWHNINDLPEDRLNEILDFVIFIRKKVYEPDFFQINNESINDELKAKSRSEIQHLEEEFTGYKTKYPHE